MSEIDQHVDAVAALTERLYAWQTPSEFQQVLDRLRALINKSPRKNVDAHRHREFAPWREGWVLAEAVDALGIERMRLLRQAQGTPDAEIDTGAEIVRVEITELVDPDEKPNIPKQYPADDGGPDVWRKRAESLAELLEKAGEKKKAKPYAAESVLLIYANNGAIYFDVGRPEGEQAISDFLRRYSSAFRRIHILWDGRFY